MTPAAAIDGEPRPLRIGLSARLLHNPPAELNFPGKTLQYLEQSIAHWVMAHGALAFMVPTIESGGGVQRRAISVRSYGRELDALVLQGGADLAPESYGARPLDPAWAGDRIRDRYEVELFWEFVIQGKPVLGICRGCQLINVALGGTLYQDIPTCRPDAARHLEPRLYDNHRHEVIVLPATRLADLYPGRRHGQVISIHHQAIERLGNDLLVEAQSGDGIIEAIRWKGAGYVAGFQWHPEFHRGDPELLDSTPIMLDFLAAARRARHDPGTAG